MELINDDPKNWENVHHNEYMTVTKRKSTAGGNGFVLIRGTIILPDISKEEVFRAIYDIPVRGKWDTILSEIKVIEKVRETCDIVYCALKVG